MRGGGWVVGSEGVEDEGLKDEMKGEGVESEEER